MRITTLKSAVVLLFFLAGCSKHQAALPPLSPTDSLLIGSPWALQKSDTITYDASNNNIVSHTVYIPAGCSDQLHYVFYRDQVFQLYKGCTQPSFDPTPPKSGDKWSWYSGRGTLSWLFTGGSPRSPYIVGGGDTILLLTKDSLVLSMRTGSTTGSQVYPHGFLTNTPPTQVTDVYTH